MRRIPSTFRQALALLCSVLFLHGAAAQNYSLRVVFEKNPAQSTVVGSFRRAGSTYISLNDLALVAHLNTYENRETGKLEIKFPAYRVKVTARNPFLVITEGNRQSVVQLPHAVLFAANSFFLPLEANSSLLTLLLDTPSVYEPALNLLRIGTQPASAYDIPTLQFEEKANGTLIRIVATKRLTDAESWFDRHNWLYVTVPDARADTGTINSLTRPPLIREIVAIQSPTSVQLTFHLSGKIASSELLREESSNDLLLAVHEDHAEEKPPPPPEVIPEEPSRSSVTADSVHGELPSDTDALRERWKMDVIVLDAGHGGKDWGAIGVTGVREKDVALGVTLKLGHLLEKNLKGVKVVYTRKDDRFVELDRRGQIANEAGGKLFISIHANSLPRKPSRTRGFEVYLLRPGRTEEAIAIAERENSVIQLEEGYEHRYKELTDENFILVTMAQSAHVKASEQFAALLQQELSRRTSLPDRGVKQAGFYVLVGASMPNVLVETAYISNREDERFLKSDSGQQKIAEAIYRAVREYREEYRRLLDEGKDLGQK